MLCCELIEHLPSDPMHMMSEINRILKPGGHLVLTTPNIVSNRAIAAILQGYHPGFFPPTSSLPSPEPRSRRGTRESTRPARLRIYFKMQASKLRFWKRASFAMNHTRSMAGFNTCFRNTNSQPNCRGDGIYAVGVKRGPVRDRYPCMVI